MPDPVNNRYDFVLLFDVADGNPNGDPDAGNLPRMDPETGEGLVTDVCLKRKVRNYVTLTNGDSPGHRIFIKERTVLNETIEEAYQKSEHVKQALAAWETWKKNKKNPRPAKHYEDVARDWMCENFFDVRCFGAVMSTGEAGTAEGDSKIRKTAGQVRGPVQLTFARSVSPVVPLEHAITRMAVTNVADLEKERTIGRKNTISYGLYRAHGFVSSKLAEQTGFGEDDLALLWDALWNMFDHDRSAARGLMSTRALIRFRHESALGNAPAHELFERVKVARKDGVSAPRNFSDFGVDVRRDGLPAGVSIVDGRP